ncbi:MAG: HAD family hydrolase [Anaerolineae bacterium]|jgi:putative hydrolase of the HAD superfamily
MVPLPKAILLDLDDTIIALSGSADPCWRQVCGRFSGRFSVQVDGRTPQALFDAIKESRAWFWSDSQRHQRWRMDLVAARREIVARAFDRLGVEAPELANEVADTFSRERDAGIYLLPGATEALRHFRQQGVRLGLVTNGMADSQRRKIGRFGLASFFDCIVIEGEFGAGKPDGRVYAYALAQLGVQPEEVWMVGDNLEWDVAGPQRTGIKGIWIDLAGSGLPEDSAVRPDLIVGSLAELAELM